MSRGFRIWDTESECYLPVSRGGNDGVLGVTINGDGIIYLEDGEANIQNTGVIIERDTGLKDKNGKKIYDGDIVKCGDWLMRVVWEKDFASFEVVYPDNNIEYGVFTRASLEWVVIGNIQENPELLEN